MKRRAVFLDRDGVINEAIIRDGKPYPPSRPEEVVVVAGADRALARLKDAGFLLLVITNQPDVSRGTTPIRSVEEIHTILREHLPLDDFFTCIHDDRDECLCRKPLPGLLLQAATKYAVDLRASYLIGDRWRDIDAGAAAGCRTVLINHRYNERSSKNLPTRCVLSLAEAIEWILEQEE